MNGKRVGCHGCVRYVTVVWWQAKDNSSLEWAQLTQGPRAVRNACQDNALVVALPRHNEALREAQGPKWQISTLKFFHGVLHRRVKGPEQQTAENFSAGIAWEDMDIFTPITLRAWGAHRCLG